MAVANRDGMPALDRHLVHGVLHRVRPVAGKTVDAAPDQVSRRVLPWRLSLTMEGGFCIGGF